MYDFKREGFPGFPLGQKIEFYERKTPGFEDGSYRSAGYG